MKQSPSTLGVHPFISRTGRIALRTALGVAVSSAWLGACQTQPDRDLGDSLEDRRLDLAPPPAPTEPFGVVLSTFAGRWQGTAEEPLALGGERDTYTFPSGSAQILLDIALDEAATGLATNSTIVFGSGSAPPPPVDPEIGYPTDVDYAKLGYFNRDALAAAVYSGPLPPYEGFPYNLRDLQSDVGVDETGKPLVADGVLHLGFDTAALLAPWCELQEPRYNGFGFDCLGNVGALADADGNCFLQTPTDDPDTIPESLPIDCGKLFLCSSYRFCECTETECSYRFGEVRTGELLVRRDGDSLVGIFSNTAFSNERQLPTPLGTVRFTRVAD